MLMTGKRPVGPDQTQSGFAGSLGMGNVAGQLDARPIHCGSPFDRARCIMTTPTMTPTAATAAAADLSTEQFPPSFAADANRVLRGDRLTEAELRRVLESSDAELLDLLAAAFRIRRENFGTQVQLYQLQNAKSGLCPEDCHYCSQSKVSDAAIPKYRWLDEETLLDGAREARANRARTYCIVASGRGPSDREIEHVTKAVRRIKSELGMHVCACLGLLKPAQAAALADAGVDRINHNLNTSREHYAEICTTHTYDDRLETLRIVRESGMEICSGLIVGMREGHDDFLATLAELAELDAESVPINFLNAIDGTPLEDCRELSPQDCLRALCAARFALPTSELRVAGGREVNLRSLQPLALYAANSIFVSDYLTTEGQRPDEDYQMIADLGFEIVESASRS